MDWLQSVLIGVAFGLGLYSSEKAGRAICWAAAVIGLILKLDHIAQALNAISKVLATIN